MNFVRKVLGIVTAQMTLTVLMANLSSRYATIALIVLNPIVVVVSVVAGLISLILLLIGRARMIVPLNYMLLFTFTWCQATIVSLTTVDLDPDSVLNATDALILVTASLFTAALSCNAKEKLLSFLAIGFLAIIFIQLAHILVLVAIGGFS